MHIPLTESPARITLRRAFRVMGLVVVAVLIGWVLVRTIPALFWWRLPLPVEATNVVLVQKTQDSLLFTAKNLSATPALTGIPWSFNDFLAYSRRGVLLVTDNHGQIALVIDHEPPESLSKALASYGYAIHRLGGKRAWLITGSSIGETKLFSPPLASLVSNLLPGYDGELFALGNQTVMSQGVINLEDDQLTIHTNLTPWVLKAPTPSNLGEIATRISLTANTFGSLNPQIPHNLSGLVDLLTNLKVYGGEIILGQDLTSQTFRLSLPTNQIPTDDLISIGTDLLALPSLSTLALTLEDESQAGEIRLATEPVVTVREEDSFRFIALNDAIFITVTPILTLISNRQETTNSLDITADSCLKHSWGSVQGNPFQSTGSSLYQASSLATLLTNAKTISFTGQKLRFCW